MALQLGLGTVVLAASGCPDDVSQDTDGVGSGSTSSPMTAASLDTGDPPGMTGMTGAPVTTGSMDTGTTAGPDTSGTDGGTTDGGTTDGGTTDGGTTAGGTTAGADCVDEDLGSVVGDPVASGNTEGHGDDFDWDACFGGGGSSDDGPGVSDSGYFGTSGGFSDTGFFGTDTGFFGTDTGFFGTDTGFFGSDTGWVGTVTGFETDTGWVGTGTGGNATGEDYVLSWVPPATGPFVVSLEGSSYDTVLSVTEPACGGAVLACNDDCFGLDSGLVFEATAGETVFIVVDGYGGAVGPFTLSIAAGSALDCGFGGGTDSGPSDSGN